MTLGENIGDNGGLNIAFRALQNVMKTEKLGVKDGFTPNSASSWHGHVYGQAMPVLSTCNI